MKTEILKKIYLPTLLGLVLTLSGVMSVHAQGLGYLDNPENGKFIPIMEAVLPVRNDGEQEELKIEEINFSTEEVATVTLINKMGEVVAVLRGEKSVLDTIYLDRISKSYFLSSYGIHEVYLIK